MLDGGGWEDGKEVLILYFRDIEMKVAQFFGLGLGLAMEIFIGDERPAPSFGFCHP